MRFLEVHLAQLETIRLLMQADEVTLSSEVLENPTHSLTLPKHISARPIPFKGNNEATAHHLLGGYDIYTTQDKVLITINCPHTPASMMLGDSNVPSSRRREIPTHKLRTTPYFSISLSYAHGYPDTIERLFNPIQACSSTNDSTAVLIQALTTTAKLLSVADQHSAILLDNLTQLNSRLLMQVEMATLCERHTVGLVMLHCRNLQDINQQFGMVEGDRVIAEIAHCLQTITRDDDLLCRFGGALFGVAFPVLQQGDTSQVARKLQGLLEQKRYLNGAIQLDFCAGSATMPFNATNGNSTEAANLLFSQADQALIEAQKEATPLNQTVSDANEAAVQYSHLNSIFTADTQKDYRNMLLLWDITSTIADETDFEVLLKKVITRLAKTYDFAFAGLYGSSEVVEKAYTYKITPQKDAAELDDQRHLDDHVIAPLAQKACRSRQLAEYRWEQRSILVAPLGINTSDCFYILAKHNDFTLPHDAKVLLSSLTMQLGKALRRARLEEQVNTQLLNQVEALQESLHSVKVIHQSESMRRLLRQAQRAATTDATILITGESGTGKERLMHAVHQFSPRRNQPLVIVDCGAIPDTLIESELFGHVKGAFTGATGKAAGKIKEADGGTLILDEIGELPLLMQSKLLRFVQEKHYSPVGSTEHLDVDVKIIAMTNRNLAEEVERGNFRKDLYYRLNVVTLEIPPLRERAEDIPLLANHFLSEFAERHGTQRHHLSADTLSKMQQYDWPGNIRELENLLMQATLLSESQEIEWQDLKISLAYSERNKQALSSETSSLNHEEITPPVYQQRDVIQPVEPVTNENTDSNNSNATFTSAPQPLTVDIVSLLNNAFSQVLEDISTTPHFATAPIGKWLDDDLFTATYQATHHNVRETASRLNISLSTARRRSNQHSASIPSSQRPSSWKAVTDAIVYLANGSAYLDDCLQTVKLILLEQILIYTDGPLSLAAQRLGVSEPTLYKLKKQLNSAALHSE